MDFKGFKDVVEDFFDLTNLSTEERKFICTKYCNSYLLPSLHEHKCLEEVLRCVNLLATQLKEHNGTDLPSIPPETFRGLLVSQDAEYPYNCRLLYDLFGELKTNEALFNRKPSYDAFEEAFNAIIDTKQETMRKLFETQKFCLECCISEKDGVHKVLEAWLTNTILPEYHSKTISKEDMDNIVKVAELVEAKVDLHNTNLNTAEAVHLMFDGDDSLKGLLNLKHLVKEIVLYKSSKIAINSEVTFELDNQLLGGRVIGLYEKDYIISHIPLAQGVTASVVKMENIKGVM